jgi:hypothetical protein
MIGKPLLSVSSGQTMEKGCRLQANALARRVLIQSSPEYAQERVDQLFDLWALDMAERPDVYQAAIDRADSKYQPILRDMLPRIVQEIQTTNLTERQRLNQENIARVARYQVGDDIWLRVWIDTYFAPGSDVDNEFSQCCVALHEAGRI